MSSAASVLHLPSPAVGQHPLFVRLLEAADRVAPADIPVVLYGETGSGKEVLAQRLHAKSHRRGEFVAVNAAALPESLAEAELFGVVRGAFTGATQDRPGLLEQAHQGTLLLDEAGDLTPGIQARLLRALETGRVRRVGDARERPADVRLILCSQVPSAELVQRGRWRADFLYRVSGVELRVPALRERATDVPLLVNHFLFRRGRPPLEEMPWPLLAHPWPGNVRELRTIVDRAILRAGEGAVTLQTLLDAIGYLPDHAAAPAWDGGAAGLRHAERAHLEQVLRSCGHSVPSAAAAIGLSRSQFYRRMRALGIPTPRAGPR